MSVWLHSTVLATTLAAVAAVGIAGIATHKAAPSDGVAPRGDRLVVAAGPVDPGTVTIEKRSDGMSVLTRIQVAHGE